MNGDARKAQREYMREYRRKERETMDERTKEAQREYMRQWRQQNKEKVKGCCFIEQRPFSIIRQGTRSNLSRLRIPLIFFIQPAGKRLRINAENFRSKMSKSLSGRAL